MNPWHDLSLGEEPTKQFQCVIEIPRGSKNKYELDKETGMLRLDRALHSAVHYPADYGFLPRTYTRRWSTRRSISTTSEAAPRR